MSRLKRAALSLWFALMALIIAGCSSPTVHLYGRYLTEEQQLNVTNMLLQHSLKVSVNQHQFPASISDTTIVYSPFISDPETIPLLTTELATLNWQITRASALKEGNHWFQKDSIGLFLVPDGINPHAGTTMRDMANLYQGEHCQQLLTLHLALDGSYTFSKEVKSEGYSYGTSGKWRMRAYPFIEMRPENGGRWLYFEAKQESTRDQISQLNLMKLVPLEEYANLAGCQFVYGQRS